MKKGVNGDDDESFFPFGMYFKQDDSGFLTLILFYLLGTQDIIDCRLFCLCVHEASVIGNQRVYTESNKSWFC